VHRALPVDRDLVGDNASQDYSARVAREGDVIQILGTPDGGAVKIGADVAVAVEEFTGVGRPHEGGVQQPGQRNFIARGKRGRPRSSRLQHCVIDIHLISVPGAHLVTECPSSSCVQEEDVNSHKEDVNWRRELRNAVQPLRSAELLDHELARLRGLLRGYFAGG
jgi:hypothetical protein